MEKDIAVIIIRILQISAIIFTMVFIFQLVSALEITQFPQSIELIGGNNYTIPFKIYIPTHPFKVDFYINITENSSSLDGFGVYILHDNLKEGYNNILLRIIVPVNFKPDIFQISLLAVSTDEIPYHIGGNGGGFIYKLNQTNQTLPSPLIEIPLQEEPPTPKPEQESPSIPEEGEDNLFLLINNLLLVIWVVLVLYIIYNILRIYYSTKQLKGGVKK